MMKRTILLLLVFARIGTASAQGLAATADKANILLGEPFHLQVKGTFPQGQQTWFVLDTLPHFEIIERSTIDTQTNYLGTTLVQTFTLTSWDSGRWQLPPIEAGRARSAPVTISVSFTSPFDPNQPYHDMRDLIEVKRPITSNWHWYLVFGLVLLLLFLLFFPKEKKRPPLTFVRDVGAYKKALLELDRLEKASPPAPELYTALVAVFRDYLQRSRNIRSHSRTTDDLAVQLAALSLPRTEYGALVQSLRLSDLVKYARYNPTSEENRQALQTVREGITQIEQLKDAV